MGKWRRNAGFDGINVGFLWKKCEDMVFAWALGCLNGVFMLFVARNNAGNKVEVSWILGNVTNNPKNMGGIPVVFLFLHQNLGIGQTLTAETNLQLSYNIVSVCM